MRFNRGEIVLVPFPFADLSAAKKRPVLIGGLCIKSLANAREEFVARVLDAVCKRAGHSV